MKHNYINIPMHKKLMQGDVNGKGVIIIDISGV